MGLPYRTGTRARRGGSSGVRRALRRVDGARARRRRLACVGRDQIWVDLIHKVPNPVGEADRHAYLSNLYVQPSARGGVGTLLLQTALAWARANGIDRVVLWPSARSVTLYRRHQFRRDADVMELNVLPDDV